ncbi:hypothetical protein [Sulfitobacter sp. R18_1]|uniref:hypothetical protein n=1 Tax=Sulfitobacter sp. R18_1 TaxID=2821104 RepID=UPI001ADBCAA5|nr:hypothetical protein [Sulfitobacter sp. R18_1]MBO9427895.1 hypothetical protein [Sulfitobacter sp. R18_1]
MNIFTRKVWHCALALMLSISFLMSAMPAEAGRERIVIKAPYDHYEHAATYYGKSEDYDRRELTELFRQTIGRPVDPVKTPWCAGFVDAMLVKAGKQPLNSLWARDFLKMGTPVAQPKKGDLVVLSRGSGGHVGFFHRFVQDRNGRYFVGVLGGNNEGPDNNGKVGISYFPLNRVLGYRAI